MELLLHLLHLFSLGDTPTPLLQCFLVSLLQSVFISDELVFHLDNGSRTVTMDCFLQLLSACVSILPQLLLLLLAFLLVLPLDHVE